MGWDGPYYEALSLDPSHVDLSRLNDGGHPLLAAHDANNLDAVVGVVERAWLEGDKAGATVRFAKDEMSQRVFDKVKDGILRNVSVGYSVQRYEETTQDGDEYPTFTATRWTPAELSIVPIGFDKDAKVRNHDQLTENEVEIITRSVETQEISIMDEQEKKRLEQLEAAKKAAIEAERARAADIRKAVKDANLAEEIAEEYIQRGASVEEARANIALFAKYQKEQKTTEVNGASTTSVETMADERDKKREAAVEAVLYRVDSNLFKPETGNPFLGMSLLRIMEEAGVVKRRPGMTDAQVARAAMSSSDLPYILANVAEKSAQKKYDLQPRTWSRWAKTDTLRNFKTHDRVRSGDFASLEERQESGEFKRGSFGEEREQVALKEYGKIMGFTRRMLINDDLSEIAKVASQGGVAAARLENNLVYSVLSANAAMGDGTPLFHADHDNLGTGAAISDTTIGEAFQLMRSQSSVDGLDKLNLAPKYLLAGPSNEVVARKYLASISPTQASNVNVFSNALELIIDAELSSNDYFFAADQNAIDTVVLFHLEGEERPRVESRNDFEKEELEIKVAHSAVAQAMDHRGLVKNANAS